MNICITNSPNACLLLVSGKWTGLSTPLIREWTNTCLGTSNNLDALELPRWVLFYYRWWCPTSRYYESTVPGWEYSFIFLRWSWYIVKFGSQYHAGYKSVEDSDKSGLWECWYSPYHTYPGFKKRKMTTLPSFYFFASLEIHVTFPFPSS